MNFVHILIFFAVHRLFFKPLPPPPPHLPHTTAVYECPRCDNGTITTFPRYNHPRSILKSRRGRCGEYANLYGLFLRSLGFDVRYVLDFTDHVWVEAWSDRTGRWIHADGCEGIIDEPHTYERGWGKKLSYVVAFGAEGGGRGRYQEV